MNNTGSCEAARRRSLIALEIRLRRELEAVDAPPFIGLLEVERNDRDRIRELVPEAMAGCSDSMGSVFNIAPVAAAWSVASCLTEDYGDQDAAVYPIIENALGITLSPAGSARRNLFNQFSDVCRKYGLALMRGGRMVDAYLVQAGVSRPQLCYVIEAFFRAERAFGPPPTHATGPLNSWEDDALDFLRPGISIPRHVLETDDTGFHAAVFARCRSGKEPNTEFEKYFWNMCKEVRDRAPGQVQDQETIVRPRLKWSAGVLSLSVPKLEGRLRVSFDDQDRRLRGGIDWPVPQPWPRRTNWSASGASGEIEILTSEQLVLAFDLRTGRLLNRIGKAQGSAEIDATTTLLIARSSFSVDGADAVETGPESFAMALSLGSVSVSLELGDRRISLISRPRPRLWVENGIVAKGRSGDLLIRDAVVLVDSGRNIEEMRSISVAIGDRTVVREIALDGTGRARFSPASFIDANGDPAKIRVALLPPAVTASDDNSTLDHSRAVAAFTAWIWPALEAVDAGIVLRTANHPTLVAWDRCRHVMQSDLGYPCLDRRGGYTHARISFDTEQGRADFDIPWPGISIARIAPDGETHPLVEGTRLVISQADLDASIAIASPDPKASLSVRGRLEANPFTDGARRVLSMRDLATDAPDDRVILKLKGGAERILLEISQSMEPERFSVMRRGGGLDLQIKFPKPIEALRFELHTESGEVKSVEFALRQFPVDGPPPTWFNATIDDSDADLVIARIDLSSFRDGIAFTHILARHLSEDSFRPLRSGRGEIFAFALTAFTTHNDMNDEPVSDLDLIRRQFLTLSNWVSTCLAEPCREQADGILWARWKHVGSVLSKMPGGVSVLLEAGFAPPPANSPPLWIPIHHPLSIYPELYGASATAFRWLRRCEAPGAAEMASLADLSPNELTANRGLSPVAFIGFENAHNASETGETLAGFSISRYFSALDTSDIDPSAGWFWRGEDLLGPAHWRAAYQRLQERLEDVDFDSDYRGPAVRRLIQEAARRLDGLGLAPRQSGATNEESGDLLALWCSGFPVFSIFSPQLAGSAEFPVSLTILVKLLIGSLNRFCVTLVSCCVSARNFLHSTCC